MLKGLLFIAGLILSTQVQATDWVPFGKEWKTAKFEEIYKQAKKLGIPIKYTIDKDMLGLGHVPNIGPVNYLQVEFDKSGHWKSSSFDFMSIDNAEDEYGRMYWIDVDWVLEKVVNDFGRPTLKLKRINLVSNEKHSVYEWDKGYYTIRLGLLDEFIQGRVRLKFIRKG